MNFIGTGLRELGLKVRRQRTRMALRHVKRLLKRSEIVLGREGTSQAASFPEVRNEIVALKKLEQEQKEVAVRIAQIEAALKQIETERKANAAEQSEAIAQLEADKKPVLQTREDAKNAAAICDRELTSVEARLQANDADDRELMRQVAALQAEVPAPDDLEGRTAALSARRARLPQERAEISRAREGSADACRAARHKLAQAEEELAAADRNITRVREEWEGRARALAEKARSQHDALRDARAQHQTVEERKDPAYLNIGRHLATQGIAPPNAPHLLHDVLRHRQNVERHLTHTQELKVLSQQIDKQHLRKFYFAFASIVVLLGLIVLLAFQTSPRREWLPQETDTILSLNTERFDRDDVAKRWRNEDFWQATWPALIGAAANTPRLKFPGDASRLTRAVATAENAPREFLLVELRNNIAKVVRDIAEDRDFEKRTISGLPVWQHNDFTVARIGPNTLAVGPSEGVDELVRVRLGMSADLQIGGQLFSGFQALDSDTTVRLTSRDPAGMARVFQPIFTHELLDRARLISLGFSLQSPLKSRIVLNLASAQEATELAKSIGEDPKRWLQLEQSSLLFFAQPPQISRSGAQVDLRFNMPEESARVLLQRLARTDATPGATASR